MTVYVVARETIETRPTECSYDDGYYDDYYDEEFYSSETICICATEELAAKIAEREDDSMLAMGHVYYYPVEVIEEEAEYDKSIWTV